MLFVEQAYHATVQVVLGKRLNIVSLEVHGNALCGNSLAHQVILNLVGATLGEIHIDAFVTGLYIGITGDGDVHILVVTEPLQRKNGCKTMLFCTRLGINVMMGVKWPRMAPEWGLPCPK